MTQPNWYEELGLPPDAGTEQIAHAVEQRSRQATALANTSPERSQQLREQIRAIKRDLLSGGAARDAYDASVGVASSPRGPAEPGSPSGVAAPSPDEPTARSHPNEATSLGVSSETDAPSLAHGGLESSPKDVTEQVSVTPAAPPTYPPPAATAPPVTPSPGRPAGPPRRSNRLVMAVSAGVVVALGIGGIVLVTSNSGSGKPAAQKTSVSTSASVAAPTPTVPSVSATPTFSEPAASDTAASDGASISTGPAGPGDVALSHDDLSAACGDPNGPFPDPNDDTSSVADGEWDGSIDRVLDSGIVIATCEPGIEGLQNRSVAIVATTKQVLWNRVTQSGDDGVTVTLLDGGVLSDLYLLTTTDHPASGLANEFWTRTLTAFDVRTGKDVWTKPFEAAYKSSDTSSGSADEEHGTSAGQTIAVVHVNGWTAVNAANGAVLWTRTDLNDDHDLTPVDHDRGVYTSYNYNSGHDVLVCVDLATNHVVWSTDAGAGDVLSGSSQLIGRNYWVYNENYVVAFDIVTGKRTAFIAVPGGFVNPLVTPTLTVAVVGSQLRLYKTGQWNSPVWSQSSAQVQPLAVTSKSVIVDAQAGQQLLDASDGSLVETVQYDGVEQDHVTGGLLQTDEGVVLLGGS